MGIAQIKPPVTPLSEEEIILHILKELDQIERNILGLYFYEKLSVSTISELINIPEKKVNSHLSIIMNKIKGEFKGDHLNHVQKTPEKRKKAWKGNEQSIHNFPVHDR